MPINDTYGIGYKYPFNACEILSSDNNAIFERFVEVVNIDSEGLVVNAQTDPTEEELDEAIDQVSRKLDMIKIKGELNEECDKVDDFMEGMEVQLEEAVKKEKDIVVNGVFYQ
jgi:hypothetical protein